MGEAFVCNCCFVIFTRRSTPFSNYHDVDRLHDELLFGKAIKLRIMPFFNVIMFCIHLCTNLFTELLLFPFFCLPLSYSCFKRVGETLIKKAQIIVTLSTFSFLIIYTAPLEQSQKYTSSLNLFFNRVKLLFKEKTLRVNFNGRVNLCDFSHSIYVHAM